MTKQQMLIELYKRIYKARRETAYYYVNFGEGRNYQESMTMQKILIEYADAIQASPILKTWFRQAWEEGKNITKGDVEAFGRQIKDEEVSEGLYHVKEKVYNPEKQYVVNRDSVGRPRRVLTEDEEKKIMKLRNNGFSINDIANELGINNRIVMKFCKEKL